MDYSNIRFHIFSNCPFSINLSASNISMTSAELSWTTGGASNWNIQWGLQGFTLGNGTFIENVTNPYPLSGLSASNVYDFYVQDSCGIGDVSSWSGPFTFNTALCDTNEQCYFALYFNDSYGDGWNGAAIIFYQDSIQIQSITMPDSSVYSDSIALCPGIATDLAFTSGSYDSECGFTMLSPFGDTIVSFATGGAPLTDGIFFSFFSSCTPPTCPSPDNLSALNITDSSAVLSWITGGANNWNIEWGTTGFILGTGTFLTDSLNPYPLSGLLPSTSYDYYVQDSCDTGDVSIWVGPYTFTTACGAISTFPFVEDFENPFNCWTIIDKNADADQWQLYATNPYQGSQCIVMYSDGNTANDDWLISPQFNLTGNQRLRFFTRCQSVSEPDELQVLLSTATADPDSFINIVMASTPINFINYTEYILNLNLYSGPCYLAFVRNQAPADGWRLYLDYVVVEDLPSCPEPTGLTASNITSASAVLSWITGGASNWNIEWGPAGFIQGTGVLITDVSNPYPLSGLAEGTSYDFYVQDSCAPGDVSLWTGPFTFSTAISNVNIIIEHTYDGDLDITLESPSGVIVELTTDNGGSGENFGIVDTICSDYTSFNMTADSSVTIGTAPFLGSYIPEGNFTGFNDGSNPNGTWFLHICDDVSSDIGTLEYAELVFSTITIDYNDIAIVEPQPEVIQTCNLSGSEYITISIVNQGPQTVSAGDTIIASYQIDSDPVSIDTIILPADLITGDTLQYTFNEPYDFSALGSYNWTINISYSFDTILNNNQVGGTYEHIEMTVEIDGGDTIQVYVFELPVILNTTDVYDEYLWSNYNGTLTGTDAAFDAPEFDWYYVTVQDNATYCQAIDSVNIEEIPQVAVDLIISVPEDGGYYEYCNMSPHESVRMILQNAGLNVIPAGDTVSCRYRVDGGSWFTQLLILGTDLNPAGQKLFQFSQTYDFSILTVYVLELEAEYSADMETSNNVAVIQVENTIYSIDLDALNGGTDDTLGVFSYPVTLDAGAGFQYYLWNTGDDTQIITVNADGWYVAEIFNDYNCHEEDSIYVLNYTANQIISHAVQIHLYPNPASDNITLSVFTKYPQRITINLHDVQGKQVYYKSAEYSGQHAETIDVSGFAQGVYFMRIITKETILYEKIVIQ
ncbi:MAG: choice-of-anchor J domain-containing protein [Bacteroidia bacterium]|nr:choice-of-anchor J domain-containing protein [Bacteroidia bacterium]